MTKEEKLQQKVDKLELQVAELEKQVKHLNIYKLSWQRARNMLGGYMEDKKNPKEQKKAMMEIYHTMTEAINHEIKPFLGGGE